MHTPAVMVEGATASAVIDDGNNGFLIENDIESFALKLKELISDPDRVHRAGVQASHTIVRSWEDVVDEVLDRYNALIRRRSEINRI